MKIKQGKKDLWQTGLENNQDFYGRGVYNFAERWANEMERIIDMDMNPENAIVVNADKVYFFTDIISHSKYYKYMNVVREKKADFGYIHGVNIEKNIRDIYKDLQGD